MVIDNVEQRTVDADFINKIWWQILLYAKMFFVIQYCRVWGWTKREVTIVSACSIIGSYRFEDTLRSFVNYARLWDKTVRDRSLRYLSDLDSSQWLKWKQLIQPKTHNVDLGFYLDPRGHFKSFNLEIFKKFHII